MPSGKPSSAVASQLAGRQEGRCVISSGASSSFKSCFCVFILSHLFFIFILFFFNCPFLVGVVRAQLGASRPKSLLQGIINSGVSQGRLVFIKRRQLNTVAALQCYNWKADWDDVHQEGPAPRHRGGMGRQGWTRTRPLHANAQPGASRPYTLWMGNKGLGGKQRKKEGTCPRPADSQELAGCLPGRLHCVPVGPWQG